MDLSVSRLPPQNLDAEQAVLGAILLENNALLKSLEFLSDDDFHRRSHRKIYCSMKDLFEKNEPVDILTLSEKLKEKKELEDVGGVEYLTLLCDIVPTAANIEFHSKIVKDKAVLRNLISVSTSIITKSYEEASDTPSLLDYAEKSIFDLTSKKITKTFYSLDDIVKQSIKHIETLYNKKELITGIPTGYKDFDEITAGLQRSDLIIIAGRPSMGKTAFCLNIGRNAALLSKVPIAIFSLEMSKEQLGLRLLCSEAKISASKMKTGYLSKDSFPDLIAAAARLSEAPIYIDDTPSISALDIKAKTRRLKADKGLGLIIIDYLQLMKGRMKSESRQLEVSEITRALKGLAKELDVPVVALSQLSRAVEQRNEKEPMLSDLRESGSIEQDADVVAFIYRQDAYTKDPEEHTNTAKIIIGKQRNGPTGSITLSFLKEFTRFENYTNMPGSF